MKIRGLDIDAIDELAADYVIAGFEHGIEQGREQGKQIGERKTRHVIAARALTKGIDLETTAEITGLSKRDMRQIGGK